MQDLDTGRTYLRNHDKMKLHPGYKKPDSEIKTVKIVFDSGKIPLKSILKKPGSTSRTYKNVVFDASYHTARLIAKQSIKDWLKESSKEDE